MIISIFKRKEKLFTFLFYTFFFYNFFPFHFCYYFFLLLSLVALLGTYL
jgi:hypothetical protein